ncbi:hypothetical protein K450DRAFT_228573 [Umbelopsis ramanniana AG]|uniref:HTH araC/xylS-type domain-containing protein n=1 Tax=Umbelopsis ramanniana AG TaxID=1314678 RepID=A0AAD5EFF3_UMBRA|nr:uncharacterized protein K450DRAFT_228573 [Umbelopsis ramanniana AG]KAI8582357.1 hypothetical protein K450DRAFT_228573 [Umbelopsis ramanniana AG]
MQILNAGQQQHLQDYFEKNMGQVLLEENVFERTLDVYQVVLAQIEKDPLRLARKRRDLSQAILDQQAFIVQVQNCLSCAEYNSILTNADKIMAMHKVTSEELQFQSILDAVFSPHSSHAARDPDANQFSTALERQNTHSTGVSMEELLFLNDSIKGIACDLPITPSSSPASAKVPYSTDEERWQAVLNHERAADGHFVYCVRSTGIFCRPTCPSRRPLLSNVLFYSNNPEAENAGFRPCKRCKPQDLILPSDLRQLTAVELVKKEIEEAATQGMKQPSLRYLANKAGMSSFHFHRVFKARTGLTLDEYRKLMFGQKESAA